MSMTYQEHSLPWRAFQSKQNQPMENNKNDDNEEEEDEK